MQTATQQSTTHPPRAPHYTVQEAAKLLGWGEKKLFAWLRAERILDKDNQPYQVYINRGLFTVYAGQHINTTTGITHYYSRTDITVPGINWLRKKLAACGHGN